MREYKIVSFSVVILLVTVLFAAVVTFPGAAQTYTMQFRYNAALTGDYSAVAGSTPSNDQLLWNYTTGAYVNSSPAVANNVVYVGTGDYMSGLNHNLYAVNATILLS